MKIALIVQRYGREILGGSETLARQLAERLARRHEITVLTTTAKDYITWKNEYEPGEEKLRGVRVRRFPVDGERDIEEFNTFSETIYKEKPTREQELEWLERQGPVTPALVDYLKKEHHRFDLLVFFTYLYYPTYYGLQVAPEKSVLLPTAHDEPPLRLSIFKEMFQLPAGFLFNTEAEELLVLERFPVHKKMRETIGVGMELLDQPDPSIFRKRHNISAKYFLYAGRIDGGKGLEELFRFFNFYKEENPASGNLQLILIGKLGMKLPENSSIRYIGFVDEAEKLSAMAGAVAVLQPSKMESLSIVTLEAFSVSTPVVVNGASRVLVDHCRKANAGFYYRDFEEFEEIFNLLLGDRNLGRSLGKNGQRYVKENFGWQKLLAKYEHMLRACGRPGKEPKESRRKESSEPPKKQKRTNGEAAGEKRRPQAEIETKELERLEPTPSEPESPPASSPSPEPEPKDAAPEAATDAPKADASATPPAPEAAPESTETSEPPQPAPEPVASAEEASAPEASEPPAAAPPEAVPSVAAAAEPEPEEAPKDEPAPVEEAAAKPAETVQVPEPAEPAEPSENAAPEPEPEPEPEPKPEPEPEPEPRSRRRFRKRSRTSRASSSPRCRRVPSLPLRRSPKSKRRRRQHRPGRTPSRRVAAKTADSPPFFQPKPKQEKAEKQEPTEAPAEDAGDAPPAEPTSADSD